MAQLADGQLLCIMRTEGATPPYKPMYTSWSRDMGQTWTDPIPTSPHLQNVWPGVHVVFSTDDGRSWTDRVTLTSHTTTWGKPGINISCYADLIKVGPNRLLAISAVGRGGTQVFPIEVERVE